MRIGNEAPKRRTHSFPRDNSHGTEHRFMYARSAMIRLGDLVSDRIVVRDVFKAPEDVDVRAAIDPILQRLHRMAAAFSDFAGHFVWSI
jgi:hypothetical protein